MTNFKGGIRKDRGGGCFMKGGLDQVVGSTTPLRVMVLGVRAAVELGVHSHPHNARLMRLACLPSRQHAGHAPPPSPHTWSQLGEPANCRSPSQAPSQACNAAPPRLTGSSCWYSRGGGGGELSLYQQYLHPARLWGLSQIGEGGKDLSPRGRVQAEVCLPQASRSLSWNSQKAGLSFAHQGG